MIDLDELEKLAKDCRAAFPASTVLELAAEVRKLRETIRLQANAARTLADATIRDASIRQGLAEKARAESSPEVLASERAMNAMLTEENEMLGRVMVELRGACCVAVLALAHASQTNPVYQKSYEHVSAALDAARGAKC